MEKNLLTPLPLPRLTYNLIFWVKFQLLKTSLSFKVLPDIGKEGEHLLYLHTKHILSTKHNRCSGAHAASERIDLNYGAI